MKKITGIVITLGALALSVGGVCGVSATLGLHQRSIQPVALVVNVGTAMTATDGMPKVVTPALAKVTRAFARVTPALIKLTRAITLTGPILVQQQGGSEKVHSLYGDRDILIRLHQVRALNELN